ncbi:MAG: tetratricopeptide repeat protein [Cyclobacteriaceae bacterium]|nr:tetratricopeptide repeat protein [Cyclobacteriaceae bacterium]
MNSIASFILSLFIFFSLACHGQHKLDSLQSVLNNATDTLRIKVLTELAMEYVYTNPQKSEKLALEGVALSKTVDYFKGAAKAYHVLSISYDIRGDYVKAIESATAGVEFLQHHQAIDSEREVYASLLNGIGLAYYHQSKYNEALTSFFSALKALDPSSQYLRVANVYNNIGLVYHDLTQLDKALEYYFKSFELVKNTKHAVQAGRSANNIGLIYNEKQDFISAIKYYEISLAYKREIADENGISASYLNLGITYKRLKDYPTALRYLELSESIKLKLDDKLGLLNVQDGKTDILIQLKRFKEAEVIALKNLKLLDKLHTTEPKIMVYNRLYNLHESQGNYKEALTWYIRTTTLKDSLFTAEKNKQALEIETKYETEKKEQTIRLLEGEKQIQLIWQYILAGTAIAIGIIYLLQRSRTRKAKELLAIQKEYNAKLKETDLLKSRFFSNISHEFRTPLTLILAPIEDIIHSSAISKANKNDLQIVKRNANRLLELVNQLMDLAKLEAKKMELHLSFGNMEAFLKIIAASFETLAHQKKITFKQDLQFLHSEIKFDADKIEKIVSNLLMNSFKFTPAGGTVILTAIEKLNENKITIFVEDTGIGIPDEDKPHVFSPFHQVDEASNGDLGTGLGLSLVKELVKLHNGSIELTSTVNYGTKITVVLPLFFPESQLPLASISSPAFVNKTQPTKNTNHEAETISDRNFEEANAKKQTVLIVEDNPDLQKYIKSILHNHYVIAMANDEAEGFDLACELMPDLIIFDMSISTVNGHKLFERLKKDQRTSHIPIIVLTAKVDLQSSLNDLKSEVDAYLVKPFAVEELLLRTSHLLNQRANSDEPTLNVLPTNNAEATRNVSTDNIFLLQVKELMEAHISDSQFGAETIAIKMNLSTIELIQKLKAICGLSPVDLLSDIRLNKAAEMIIRKENTWSEISYRVGYNNTLHFAKDFKAKFGKSPNEFNITTH